MCFCHPTPMPYLISLPPSKHNVLTRWLSSGGSGRCVVSGWRGFSGFFGFAPMHRPPHPRPPHPPPFSSSTDGAPDPADDDVRVVTLPDGAVLTYRQASKPFESCGLVSKEMEGEEGVCGLAPGRWARGVRAEVHAWWW